MSSKQDAKPPFSPILFLTVSGEPMSFFLRPGPTKVQLQPIIRSGGGVVCRTQVPGAILLADTEDMAAVPNSATHFYVSTQYIRDCVEKNEQLEVDDYRFNPQQTRLTRQRRGGSVGRIGYTSEEDAAILGFISKHKRDARGNRVWQEMERQRLTNHSWQSMKDRYRKHLSVDQSEEGRRKQPERGRLFEKDASPQEDVPEASSKKSDAPGPSPKKSDFPEPSPKKSDGPEPSPKKSDGPEPSPKKSDGPEPSPKKSDGPEPSPKKSDGPEPSPKKSAGPEPSPEKSVGPEPSPEKSEISPLRGDNRCCPERTEQPLEPERTLSPQTEQLLEPERALSPQTEQPLEPERALSPQTEPVAEKTQSDRSPPQRSKRPYKKSPPGRPGTQPQPEESSPKRAKVLSTVPEETNRATPSSAEENPKEAGRKKTSKRKLGLLEIAAREFEASDFESDDETPDLDDAVSPGAGNGNHALAAPQPTQPESLAAQPQPQPQPDPADLQGERPEIQSDDAQPAVAPAGSDPAQSEPVPSTSKAHFFLFESESQTAETASQPIPDASQCMSQAEMEEGKQHLRRLMKESNQSLVEVTKALLRSSGSVSAALRYLLASPSARLQQGPFWTRRDDAFLLSGDTSELCEKFGEERVAKRMAFLDDS